MHVKSNIWFENSKSGFFGKGRIELLEQIDAHGSISAAAKAMKMSYKAAWDAVNEMNNLSDAPIVKRESGGKGGGGTVLTENGHTTIALYKELEKMQSHFWSSIEHITDDITLLEKFSKTMTLRTSARNQLLGVVKVIAATDLGATVTLQLCGGETIDVFITRRSLEEMEIALNKELFVLLKSSWIHLAAQPLKNRSNTLKCKIETILKDAKTVEVEVITSGDISLTLSLPREQFNALALKEGDEVWSYFDPSHAILAL